MAQDEWVALEGFPKYFVNPAGEVRHYDRMEPRKTGINKQGFSTVVLFGDDNNSRYLRQVNKLVADSYLRPRELYLRTPNDFRIPGKKYAVDEMMALFPITQANSVWHIDGNLQNCHVDNLLWDTRGRVMEWNDMHRRQEPRFQTPKVQNMITGRRYEDAYAAAMNDRLLESKVVWWAERHEAYDGRLRCDYQYIY